jgi:beta-mannanase
VRQAASTAQEKVRRVNTGSLARTLPCSNLKCKNGEKLGLNFEQLDSNTIMSKEAYIPKSLNLLASLEEIQAMVDYWISNMT